MLFVLWVIAIWAVIGGIFGIPAAASLGASGGSKAAGIILAILAIILGIALIWLLVTNPESALSGFVWVVAVYAIIAGVVLIISAIAGVPVARRRMRWPDLTGLMGVPEGRPPSVLSEAER